MSKLNESRRSLLVGGLKALALLLPVAALGATPQKAEARVWRRRYRRRYW